MSDFPFGSSAAAAVAAVARDYGNVVHHVPRAVVRPETVDEVVAIIRECTKRGVCVAARGQGHSTNGQSQVEDGVVVDMSALRRIEHIGDGIARVQAGLMWRHLLQASVPRGLAPPVLTGYTGLSVGGTLSMGGVGGASFREGVQLDHVLELDVVTGAGELVTCSATTNEDLFDCVRGGVGQYGIIVRATIRMNVTPTRARHLALSYGGFDRFFLDLETLASREQGLDGVYGQVVGNGDRWAYVIHTVRFVDEEAADSELLAGLQCDGHKASIMNRLEYDTLIDANNEERARLGHDELQRIWQDAFVPALSTASFVEETLRGIAPRDLGPAGFVLLFPIRHRAARYSLRLPEASRVYLFDVLTSGERNDTTYVATARTKARNLFERARRVGGTLYPIGSTPMSPMDWAQQMGSLRARFEQAKHRFDPAALLAPGAGIFATRRAYG